MIIQNYNNQLKDEYRTILVAMIRTIEKIESDSKKPTQIFAAKAKSLGLTDKDITTTWLRSRAYRPDLYPTVPEWAAKTAYACLLDLDFWRPAKDQEWFISLALFVRLHGGSSPNYDSLVPLLPKQLSGENGEKWLRICVNAVRKIQETFTSAKSALHELSDCPRQSLCLQFIFAMHLCDNDMDIGAVERKEWNGQVYYEYHSLRALLDPHPEESNGSKALIAMQEAGFTERLRLGLDGTLIAEGDNRFQRRSVKVFWRLTDKSRLLLNPKKRPKNPTLRDNHSAAFTALHELLGLKRQSLCLQFLLLLNLCRFDVDKGAVLRKSWEGDQVYFSFHSLREQLKGSPNASNSDKALVDMKSIGLVDRLKIHNDGSRIAEGDTNYQRRSVTVYWSLTDRAKLLLAC